MARWKPDPTFYASPRLARSRHPPRSSPTSSRSTPVPTVTPARRATVVDLKPGSSTYGRTIGRLDMPNVGDELHHFGWNACSSALCPWSPHPHTERRYLLVPGLRSSRIHVIDVKEDPRSRRS